METRFQKAKGYARIISAGGRGNARRRLSGWLPGAVLMGLLIVLLIIPFAMRERQPPKQVEPVPAAVEKAEPAAILPWKHLTFPTAQALITTGEVTGVFQPTGTGNPESAMFGSTRTGTRGGRTGPTFHEGVDIAAMHRDRRGCPLDEVRSIAAGRVMYLNRVAGNSNYGKYVVVAHDDPIGEVYSLYAHMADVRTGIWPGKTVIAGEPLGIMGNTSSSGIPMARAHVHLEVALMSNARFDTWYRAQKLTPDHGSYNGQNLIGLDPLRLFREQSRNPDMQFAQVLAQVPRAFDIVIRMPHEIDFFSRYKPLWKGPAVAGQPTVLACAENGLPLQGRLATEEEQRLLGKRSCLVRNVDTQALGGNGARLITRVGADWVLAESGQRWLEILTYQPGAMPIGYRDTASARGSRPASKSPTKRTKR